MRKCAGLVLLCCLVPALAMAAPVKAKKKAAPKAIPFVSIMDTAAWQLTRGYRTATPWTMVDSALSGVDGWIGHSLHVGDFVLEGEFLYNGQNQGGIVLRGDRESWLPWLSGYELDIDGSGMPGEGHIHFPTRPQPYPGEARFPAGQWQRFSVRAVGSTVTVALNGKPAIKFTNDQYRYGQFCLEGEKGGVQYRKLRVQTLDKKPPEGPRSPWTELLDSAGLKGWSPSGNVTFNNGVMDIDGSTGHAEVALQSRSFVDGIVELDVWCHRPEQSRVPYRISLRAADGRSGACFVCRSNTISSCGPRCASQFPMFMETPSPEYWRFELRGQKIDALRFGENVMSCTDSLPASGTLVIAADSCLLQVRGARYREIKAVR